MSDVVTVLIRGLEVFGRHGVFAAEQELGQQFVVDVELELLACPGVSTDELGGTVDYAELAGDVARIVAGPPRRLLERVAGEIAARALEDPLAHRVVVEVRKPHVALSQTVTETAVRLERRRASTYWLGIGANLGDRLANLQGLVDALRDGGVEIEAISPVYDTAPREVADQPEFLNAVVRVRTTLAPPELLAVAKRAERRLGRTGGGMRFGPRPADCDIVYWDRGIWHDDTLEIPHPRLTERRFVLVPLLDVSDGLVHPDGRSLEAIAAGLDAAEQPVRPWADGVLG
jgi:dihydroneopterin aldolase/2-amino-4-hydroxy-6-hydroxymethyldihydropteridine diphosphokinase